MLSRTIHGRGGRSYAYNTVAVSLVTNPSSVWTLMEFNTILWEPGTKGAECRALSDKQCNETYPLILWPHIAPLTVALHCTVVTWRGETDRTQQHYSLHFSLWRKNFLYSLNLPIPQANNNMHNEQISFHCILQCKTVLCRIFVRQT